MGGDNRNSPPSAQRSGFNPRPRMGGDAQLHLLRVVLEVSIHAPAWGATHVPGAAEDQGRVSIHAPAWGATRERRALRKSTTSFNPRPRMGGDQVPPRRNGAVRMFQSTPPHGGRPGTAGSSPGRRSFNPRPRMGGDFGDEDVQAFDGVSIHAPAWGATSENHCVRLGSGVSIHAPAWGATCGG